MSFDTLLERYAAFDYPAFFAQVKDRDIERILGQNELTPLDFLTLLSPCAATPANLEAMAQKAHALTVQHFGRTIQMFSPLYLSNHCHNQCAYCGFNARNKIPRRKLTLDEIDSEARALLETGMQHVLILTGEARRETPLAYLLAAAQCLKRYFASVAIEVYPLEVGEYQQLYAAGVDGMTVFQETYDPAVYERVHLAGKKRDFHWRLNAPERAAAAGMRTVNIGALLGLAEPRSDMFLTGLHAHYLENTWLDTEIAISLPRFNAAEGDFHPDYAVSDRLFVQYLTALRLFLPRVGLTLSTRESADFRDRLLPLGVTRFSAASSTGVGGYAESTLAHSHEGEQFSITDDRSVQAVAAALMARSYQPVYKDWDRI